MRNYLLKLGKQAKKASIETIKSDKKQKVLKDYCNLLSKNQSKIISANRKDLKKAIEKKLKENLINRLLIDKKKILQIINSIKTIIKFKDPVGQTLEKWKRPNGLKIAKTTTPIGIDTLCIFNPFGLFHFSKVMLIGSFNLDIFKIEFIIPFNLFSFK